MKKYTDLQGASRVDETGKAYSRSQYQIQAYVNENTAVLNVEIASVLDTDGLEISWLSPLKYHGYKEYWDSAALELLDLGHLNEPLSEFWPRGGPHWDALAVAKSGKAEFRILVEAKSHVPELISACTAKNASSLELITRSLRATQAKLGCSGEADWLSRYYQYANRLAWLRWLNTYTPTLLLNIYFLNDEHAPTSLSEWQDGLRIMKSYMGLKEPLSNVHDIFLPALAYKQTPNF